jgi:hypothetical protein
MKGYIRTPIELAEDCYEIIEKNITKSLVSGFPFETKWETHTDTAFGEIYNTRNINGFSGIKDNEFIIFLIEYIIKEFINGGPGKGNHLKIKATKPHIKYTHKLYYQEEKLYYIKKMHLFMGKETVIYSVPKIVNDQAYKILSEKITRDWMMDYICYFYSRIY